MKKRFKVIADYPHSDHGIGDIFIATDHPNIFRSTINGGEVGNPDEFPSIFQLLAWYEDRTAEEMPEYVKVREWVTHMVNYGALANSIHRVNRYDIRTGEDGGGWNDVYLMLSDMIKSFPLQYVEPATLADYTEYLNKGK